MPKKKKILFGTQLTACPPKRGTEGIAKKGMFFVNHNSETMSMFTLQDYVFMFNWIFKTGNSKQKWQLCARPVWEAVPPRGCLHRSLLRAPWMLCSALCSCSFFPFLLQLSLDFPCLTFPKCLKKMSAQGGKYDIGSEDERWTLDHEKWTHKWKLRNRPAEELSSCSWRTCCVACIQSK